jgi:hypothetical protein
MPSAVIVCSVVSYWLPMPPLTSPGHAKLRTAPRPVSNRRGTGPRQYCTSFFWLNRFSWDSRAKHSTTRPRVHLVSCAKKRYTVEAMFSELQQGHGNKSCRGRREKTAHMQHIALRSPVHSVERHPQYCPLPETTPRIGLSSCVRHSKPLCIGTEEAGDAV